LRDLFLAVFFTSLGMQLDPGALAKWWWVILLGGAAMSTVKAVTIGFTCWSLGATASMAVAVGMSLAQGGEFGLVLLQTADAQGLIGKTVLANTIAIIVISLILTPAMVELGRRFSRRWEKVSCAPWVKHSLRNPPQDHEQPLDSAPTSGLVILAGHGQVGREIAKSLALSGVPYTVIELNPDTVSMLAGLHEGPAVVFGDVSNADVLESAGLDRAAALILTMPDESAVLAACATARRKKPSIFIAARMQLELHKRTAQELGADVVVVEELEAAKAMREAVIAHLKSPAYPV
jgi:CPA2 family monovalent cation:H+ antiporter-2